MIWQALPEPRDFACLPMVSVYLHSINCRLMTRKTFSIFLVCSLGLFASCDMNTVETPQHKRPAPQPAPLGRVVSLLSIDGKYLQHLSDSAFARLDTPRFDPFHLFINFGDSAKECRIYLPKVSTVGTYPLTSDQRTGMLTCFTQERLWNKSVYGSVTITEFSLDSHFVSGTFSAGLDPVSGMVRDTFKVDGIFNRIRLN
jgi:hypothetical protein